MYFVTPEEVFGISIGFNIYFQSNYLIEICAKFNFISIFIGLFCSVLWKACVGIPGKLTV